MDLELEQHKGTALTASYCGILTGDVNFGHLIKMMSTRFLHCKVVVFTLLLVNILEEIL